MWHKFEMQSVETSNSHDAMELSDVLYSNHLVSNLDQFVNYPSSHHPNQI
jgi:hypothetical protein